MKRFYLRVFALIVALVFMQVATARGTVGQQIQAFAAGAQLSSMLYGLQMQNGEYTKASATQDNALLELDAGIKTAVAQASKNPALVAAVKAFYVADRAYLEGAWADLEQPPFVVKAHADQLKQAVDRASSEIDLEVKLAGL